MRKSKKIIACFMAGTMAVSAAGCGSNPSSNPTTAAPATTAAAATAAESEDAAGEFEAGVYEGTAAGFGGDVTAQVTIDASGKITDLKVTGDGETPSVGGAAIDPMAEAILAAGNVEVDGVSGATITSQAIINAVKDALTKAGVLEASSGEISYTAGTYTGTADGRGGPMTVEVTVSDSAIESITVKDHLETLGIADLPLEQIPADIVEYQSLGVDTISGATLTSYGVINAVADALEQAGADTAALRQVAVNKEVQTAEDMTTQVVVAGGGMGGLMAAVTAAHEGAEVVLLEKLPFVGGSLFLAGGGMATADSEVVGAMGADDDLKRIVDYFKMVHETSEREPDYEFVEYLLGQTGPTIDYMAKELGMEPTFSDRGDYIRTNFGDGRQEVESLKKIFEDEGGRILVNAEVTDIIMEDGKAAGVKVKGQGGDFTVNADKVIIATGGASWDKDLLYKANPELNTVALSEQAIKGNSGDGFRMLEAAGAKMGEGPFIKSAYPDFSLAFRFTWRNNPSVNDSLVVDSEGKRFANEAPYNSMMLNKNMLRHESPAYYALFDTVHTNEDFLKLMEEKAADDDKNVVVYAKTIEELAGKLDMDPAVLKATYDRYQEQCEKGTDEDFGKDASHLIPYDEEGGFYGAYLQSASWGTIGGAMTDRQFHVLDENDAPIENLFAVGETATSTLFGDYYLGGFSLGYYSAAGRIAAQTAVGEINGAN